MSGLEVAGVVLGALPLVISALEHYSQGINTAERYWRYKTEFGSLTLQIKTEHHIFLNTLEQLLTGIVRIEHMAQLVEDPASNAWRDPELDGMLKGRLRSAYDVYLDNVRVMEAALRTMMEKLALDPDGKVRPGLSSEARNQGADHSCSPNSRIRPSSSRNTSDSNSALTNLSTQSN